MSVRKQHAPVRQLIQVRRPGLRVALEGVRPVVQIIDSDEQYVWLLGMDLLTVGWGWSGDDGRDTHERCRRSENVE